MKEGKVISIHRNAFKRACTFCALGCTEEISKPSKVLFANRYLSLKLLYEVCDTCGMERKCNGVNLIRMMYYLENNAPELIDTFRKVSGYFGAPSGLRKKVQE